MKNDKRSAYSKRKHLLSAVDLFLRPGLLFIVIFLGIPTSIKNISFFISSNIYVSLVIFIVLLGAFYYILMLPLLWYSTFVLEHKFSLSNQTALGWIKREIKKNIISLIITIPVGVALYLFIKHYPLHWWLYTAGLWIVISVFLAKFAPILIIPLFYKYSPIKNVDLKNKVLKLASKIEFKASGVYEINLSKDTKKANAAIVGLGKQKRILLCDTLLNNFTQDEIVAVMAHELGHYKLRHLLKSVALSAFFTILILFIADKIFLGLHGVFNYEKLWDFESLVLISAIVSVLNIFMLLINNAFSRKMEKTADIFAIKVTNNPESFISTMKKLAKQNLADPKPNLFYELVLYNHPPILRRIKLAESYKK